tara:strand:- start:1110 stop:1358 length:249 start_codon:yes stop_codon:yes gene_type:complete
MRELILKKFNEVLEQNEEGVTLSSISDDQVLLESGLDSLGFAILVALLDEELGFDPFQLTDEPIYPTTFGEFVAIYESNKKQ